MKARAHNKTVARTVLSLTGWRGPVGHQMVAGEGCHAFMKSKRIGSVPNNGWQMISLFEWDILFCVVLLHECKTTMNVKKEKNIGVIPKSTTRQGEKKEQVPAWFWTVRQGKRESHRSEKDRGGQGRKEERNTGIVLSVTRLCSEANENEFQLLMVKKKKNRKCTQMDDTTLEEEGGGGIGRSEREQSVSKLAVIKNVKMLSKRDNSKGNANGASSKSSPPFLSMIRRIWFAAVGCAKL